MGDRARGARVLEETSIPLLIHRVAAFTRNPAEGNPAGVVFGAGDADEAAKRRIATAAETAATAFVDPVGEGRWRVRFFTPDEELDFCGHAAIAAVSTIARKGELPGLGTTFETRAGDIRAFRDAPRPDVGWVIQPAVALRAVRADAARLAEALDLSAADLVSDPPPASTGSTLLVALRTREALGRARPGASLRSIGESEGVRSVHPYTLEPDDPLADAAARHFACDTGLEDAVTGSGNGALGVLLHREGRGRPLITVSQGLEAGRPGRVMVVVQDGRPHVGGPTAVIDTREVAGP